MVREHFSKRNNWKCGSGDSFVSCRKQKKKKPERKQISSSPKTNASTNISGDPMIGGTRLPNVGFCCHVTINSHVAPTRLLEAWFHYIKQPNGGSSSTFSPLSLSISTQSLPPTKYWGYTRDRIGWRPSQGRLVLTLLVISWYRSRLELRNHYICKM